MLGRWESVGTKRQRSHGNGSPAGLMMSTLHTLHLHLLPYPHLTPPTQTQRENDVIVNKSIPTTHRGNDTLHFLLSQWTNKLHLFLLSLLAQPHSHSHPISCLIPVPHSTVELGVKGHLAGRTVHHCQCATDFRYESN